LKQSKASFSLIVSLILAPTSSIIIDSLALYTIVRYNDIYNSTVYSKFSLRNMAQDMTPSTKSKQPKATTSTKQANGGNRKRGRPSAGSSATTTTAASISRVNNGAETSSASSTVSTTARATLMEEDQNPLMVQYIPRKDVDATDFCRLRSPLHP
jgi:hypothetical protein